MLPLPKRQLTGNFKIRVCCRWSVSSSTPYGREVTNGKACNPVSVTAGFCSRTPAKPFGNSQTFFEYARIGTDLRYDIHESVDAIGAVESCSRLLLTREEARDRYSIRVAGSSQPWLITDKMGSLQQVVSPQKRTLGVYCIA